MENIVYFKRKNENHDQELFDKYGLKETWIQKSQMIIVYNASDSAFSVMVDTYSGNYGSTGVDPIGQGSLGPLSKKVVEEIHQRLEALGKAGRKQINDEAFSTIVQEAYNFIASLPRGTI